MSWSYSNDPTSSQRDELRFILQDTDSTFPLLQDEELDYLLNTWMERFDSVTYVASIAAAVIARKFTGIVAVSADGVSVNTADLQTRYATMAEMLREEYKSAQIGGLVDISNLMVGVEPDPAIRPLRFGVGLHDNPEAGSQDYGGWTYDPFAMAEEIISGWAQ